MYKRQGYDCTPGGWFGTITFWTITHTKQTLLERWSLDEKYRFAQVEGVRYNSSPATHGVRLVRHENQSSNSYWNEAKSTALPMLAEQQAKLASEERAKAEKARKEAEEKRRYEAQMAAEEKAFQRVLSLSLIHI